MNKEPQVFLEHILRSINLIESYTKNMDKEGFITSPKTRDAVVHNIEIIGEAARNIPTEFKNKYPSVPWSEMIRTRDKLIHGYFGVDLDITWDVVKSNLPELKKKIILMQKIARKPLTLVNG